MKHSRRQIRVAVVLGLAGAMAAVHAADWTPAPPPPAASAAEPTSLLPALIEHSRSVARIEGGRLRGPGADLLRGLGAQAHAVMLGEQHGNQGIAEFATAYWADLAEAGFRHAVVEADPFGATALERELRRGGVEAWAGFAATRGGRFATAFYTWEPEARWVEAIVRSSPRGTTPALWGVDQVFIGSAPWLLREMADPQRGARSAAARREAAGLAGAAAAAAPGWLGRADEAQLLGLQALLKAPADARWRELAQALHLSRRIYGPHSGGAGEPYLANVEREDLMKRLFSEHHARAERADGSAPRVMLKMGAYHLTRGPSPLMVPSLGGFVAETLAARGEKSLGLLVLCGPGGMATPYFGPATRCDEPLTSGPWKFIAPYLQADAVTVFDLRSWRLRQRRLAQLPEDARHAVANFDLLVVVPGAPGSRFLGEGP